MNKKNTNLLPLVRQNALKQAYWIRFAAVALVAATWLIVAAGVLLIPSYVFLGTSMTVVQGDLKNAERALSASSEKDFLARLNAFEDSAKTLSALKGIPSATATLSTTLSVPQQGVSLRGFVYTPGVGNTPRSVAISGIANSRESLRTYQQAIQNTKGISSAELPVSSYAKESEIPFTIIVAFLP